MGRSQPWGISSIVIGGNVVCNGAGAVKSGGYAYRTSNFPNFYAAIRARFPALAVIAECRTVQRCVFCKVLRYLRADGVQIWTLPPYYPASL